MNQTLTCDLVNDVLSWYDRQDLLEVAHMQKPIDQSVRSRYSPYRTKEGSSWNTFFNGSAIFVACVKQDASYIGTMDPPRFPSCAVVFPQSFRPLLIICLNLVRAMDCVYIVRAPVWVRVCARALTGSVGHDLALKQYRNNIFFVTPEVSSC